MDDLIARLEKATAPDREIDARICYAVKPALHRMGTLEDWLATNASAKCLNYTWSIDDALTLVPEGNWWEIRQICSPTSPMRSFGRSGLFMAASHRGYGESGIAGSHDIPAVALCLSALRYRASIKTGHEFGAAKPTGDC